MTRTVTLLSLAKRRACGYQAGLFYDVFGLEAEVTPENLRRAAAAGLDVYWFAVINLRRDERPVFERHLRDAWRAFYDDCFADRSQRGYDAAYARFTVAAAEALIASGLVATSAAPEGGVR